MNSAPSSVLPDTVLLEAQERTAPGGKPRKQGFWKEVAHILTFTGSCPVTSRLPGPTSACHLTSMRGPFHSYLFLLSSFSFKLFKISL